MIRIFIALTTAVAVIQTWVLVEYITRRTLPESVSRRISVRHLRRLEPFHLVRWILFETGPPEILG